MSLALVAFRADSGETSELAAKVIQAHRESHGERLRELAGREWLDPWLVVDEVLQHNPSW